MKEVNKKTIKLIIESILSIVLLLFITSNNMIINLIVIISFVIETIFIIKKALQDKVNLYTIISISILSSLIYGIYLTITQKGQNYNNVFLFLTALIIIIINLKELLELKYINKIKEDVNTYKISASKKVKIKHNDTFKEILLEEVKDKDIVICEPEEKVLIGGTVVSGLSHFDETLITGESSPVEKSINSKLLKGSLNCENTVEYEVNLKHEIEENNIKTKTFNNEVDKISKKYLHLLIVFEIITVVISIILKTSILDKMILTLIIPCISGLILSDIPNTKELKECYKKGILVKNKNIFEEINKIDTIVLDKTGVLTNGYLSISKINNHSDIDTKELLELLGSIERHSMHALGRGITKCLKSEHICPKLDLITVDLPGNGVKAKDEKNLYYACNSKVLKKLDIINSYEKEEEILKTEGNYVIYLTKNNKVLALFGLKDVVRKDSKKVVESLMKKKLDIMMLSGDDEITSQMISKELGIEKIYAGINSENKKNKIDDLRKDNKKVLMIGNGDNDYLALNSSNIGVTIKDSTILAKDSSDIILKSNNIAKLLDLMTIGKNTINKIRENIIISMLLFIIFQLINILGFYNNILIILTVIISSISILINTIRP